MNVILTMADALMLVLILLVVSIVAVVRDSPHPRITGHALVSLFH